jgi:hypothetical protein
MVLPLIMEASGPVVTDPTTIRAQLDADISLIAPGYTSTLPGVLVEDILSTDCGAVAACDQSRVDAINSLTPYGVNVYLLDQLAAIRGLTRITAGTMQVYIQFAGTAGLVIPQGFQVTDGMFTYTTQNTVIIGTSGQANSSALAVATVAGTWNIPANTVITLVTQLPTGLTLSCNNPAAGLPANAEDDDTFRARVIAAQNVGVQGSPGFIQTAVSNVTGVLARTVVTVAHTTGFLVAAAGGDPYDVALALYLSVGDITLLRGSQILVSGATNANPTVITTSTAHGLASGSTTTISGALGNTAINGTNVVTVINSTEFSIPVNSTSSGVYTGGGFLLSDPRLQTITINDGPNTYTIVYCIPLTQLIGIAVVWDTPVTGAAFQESFSTLAIPAILTYINSLTTGQAINTRALEFAVLQAVQGSVPVADVSSFVTTVTINGTVVTPPEGSSLIATDSLSYPYTTMANVSATLG